MKIIKARSIPVRNKISYFVVSSVLLAILGAALFLQHYARALSSNYSKATGQQLTANEWNNLPADFVAKTGDTMSGPLNMGSNRISNLGNPTAGTDAVNQTAMTNAIAAAITSSGQGIKEISGANLKTYCGQTVPGATAWVPFMTGAYTDIDISAAGFTTGSIPYIFTSLGGTGYQWLTRGVTSIYPQDTVTLNDLYRRFRIYVMNDSGISYPYNTYQWHVNWCAMGN